MRQYRVMADLVIWFGSWDDAIEQLGSDEDAASRLRAETKALVHQALCPSQEETREDTRLQEESTDSALAHSSPLVQRFKGIAKEARGFLDEGEPEPPFPRCFCLPFPSFFASLSDRLTSHA